MAGSVTYDCYVANLPIHYNENEIRDIFTVAGEITGVKILPAKNCSEGKVAFVRFTNESDAHCCAQYMNNHNLDDGRTLKVRYRPKSQDTNGMVMNHVTKGNMNEKSASTGFNSAFKVEEMQQVFVSHVESPIEFWGQSCTEAFALQLDELTEKMESICPTQPKVIGQLSTEQVYGCKFSEDDLWYRCIVEKALAKNEVHVRYIDYGNAEVADRFGLVTLPTDMAILPPLCERYQVEGLELISNDSQSEIYEKGLDVLSDLINEQRIDLKIKKKEKHATIVKIYQNSEGMLLDIATKLMPTGSVRVKTVGQASSFATAVKTPVKTTFNYVPTSDTFSKSNSNHFSSSVSSNANEPPVKTAFNHVKPAESPVKTTFNHIKPAESPVKTTFNHNKPAESSVKTTFNHNKPAESFTKAMNNDLFSQPPMETTFNNTFGSEPPAKAVFNHAGPSTSDQINKPGVGPVQEDESPVTEHSSIRNIPEKKQLYEEAVEYSTAGAELYREKIENSASIIEQLKAQLAEKTNMLQGYLRQIPTAMEVNDVLPQETNNLHTVDSRVVENDLSTESRVVGSLYIPNNDDTKKLGTKINQACESSEVISHFDLNNSDDGFREVTVPKVSCKDVGGYKREMAEMKAMVDLPLHYIELFNNIGIKPPRGMLLWGPHGTGKTLIARAIANESEVFIKEIFGPDIVSGSVEDSNRKLNKAFREVEKNAPAILIIDQIDVIAPKKESGKNKIVAQLLSLLNQLAQNIFIISTAIRTNNVDPILNRVGLFDKEINIAKPDVSARLQILGILSNKLNFSKGVCLNKISEETHGYVGSNLTTLCTLAGMHGINTKIAASGSINKEMPESLKRLTINMADFKHALDLMNSSIRQTVADIPSTTWDDISGMEDVKNELKDLINLPASYEEQLLGMGGVPSKGVLLYGPHGCGKTLFAQAMSNECKCNFISVKGHELSTIDTKGSTVADIFVKARTCAPCVLYINEIELVAPANNVLNEMLIEIDNIGAKENVYVIGATSRPSEVHPAFRRSGRLQHIVHIPLPDEDARKSILERRMKKKVKSKEINSDYLEKLAKRLKGFTANDLQKIVHRVCKIASKEEGGSEDLPKITCHHFEEAIKVARRSVTDADIEECRRFIERDVVANDSLSTEQITNNDDEMVSLKKTAEASNVDTELKDFDTTNTVVTPADAVKNNYVVLLGLFTLACFIYLLGLYIYTSMRYQ